VIVKAQNAKGEPIEITGEGFLARALCHEIDHLDGVLYVDIMEHEIIQEDDDDDGDNAPDNQARAEGKAESADGEACL